MKRRQGKTPQSPRAPLSYFGNLRMHIFGQTNSLFLKKNFFSQQWWKPANFLARQTLKNVLFLVACSIINTQKRYCFWSLIASFISFHAFASNLFDGLLPFLKPFLPFRFLHIIRVLVFERNEEGRKGGGTATENK